jgi:hypothetical protein
VLPPSYTLKIEAEPSSEKLVPIYQTTRPHTPEDIHAVNAASTSNLAASYKSRTSELYCLIGRLSTAMKFIWFDCINIITSKKRVNNHRISFTIVPTFTSILVGFIFCSLQFSANVPFTNDEFMLNFGSTALYKLLFSFE